MEYSFKVQQDKYENWEVVIAVPRRNSNGKRVEDCRVLVDGIDNEAEAQDLRAMAREAIEAYKELLYQL